MKTTFIFVAMALALLSHEARSQTCPYEIKTEFVCNFMGHFTCVKPEVDKVSTCLAQQFTAQHNAQQIQLNAHAEAINSLAMMQAMMKDDLKCLNAGGQMCSADRKCYQVAGKKEHADATTKCMGITGGSLLAAIPTNPAVVSDCFKMSDGDKAWLADTDPLDDCKRFVAPSTQDTKECDKKFITVCEIAI